MEIEIRQLRKLYKNNKLVLDIDNLKIPHGKCVGIFGSNGSGKSTMLKCLCGLINYKGTIEYDGKKFCNAMLKNVGIMIETPALYGELNGIENLKTFVPFAFDVMPYAIAMGLDECLAKKVNTYSVGMKQKLAFILALLKGKDLIILDEPFVGMDIVSVNRALSFLEEKKRDGTTIILTSHQLGVSQKVCDEAYLLSNGKINRSVDCHDISAKEVEIEFTDECSMDIFVEKGEYNVADINGNIVKIMPTDKQSFQKLLVYVSEFSVKRVEDISGSISGKYLDMMGQDND